MRRVLPLAETRYVLVLGRDSKLINGALKAINFSIEESISFLAVFNASLFPRTEAWLSQHLPLNK